MCDLFRSYCNNICVCIFCWAYFKSDTGALYELRVLSIYILYVFKIILHLWNLLLYNVYILCNFKATHHWRFNS